MTSFRAIVVPKFPAATPILVVVAIPAAVVLPFRFHVVAPDVVSGPCPYQDCGPSFSLCPSSCPCSCPCDMSVVRVLITVVAASVAVLANVVPVDVVDLVSSVAVVSARIPVVALAVVLVPELLLFMVVGCICCSGCLSS